MVWPAGEAAFLTGAASGMGLGTARALVGAGARVALADIDAARLEEVASDLRAQGGTVSVVPLDVTDPDAWAAGADHAERELGPISILAQFAGVSGGAPIDSLRLDVWRWVHRINVEAQFMVCRLSCRDSRRTASGRTSSTRRRWQASCRCST